MANRFWINGGVDYYWSTTGNWSTSSGGGGGASVPIVGDNAIFDSSSPNTCTLDGNYSCDYISNSKAGMTLDGAFTLSLAGQKYTRELRGFYTSTTFTLSGSILNFSTSGTKLTIQSTKFTNNGAISGRPDVRIQTANANSEFDGLVLGTAGFEMNHLILEGDNSTRSIILLSGATYKVYGSIAKTDTNDLTLQASIGGNTVRLDILGGVGFVRDLDVTDIDSGYGLTIYNNGGTLTNTGGWTNTPYSTGELYDYDDLVTEMIYCQRNYELKNDIDCSSHTWTVLPLGTGQFFTPYIGTFEGNNYTISNLTINTTHNYTGFIPILGSSSDIESIVQNLNLDNLTIMGGIDNNYCGDIGSLTGWIDYATITNCDVTNSTVTPTNDEATNVGLLAGEAYYDYDWESAGKTISNCSVSGTVSGEGYVGGLIGASYGLSYENCNAAVTVIATKNNYSYYLGGLIGYATSSEITPAIIEEAALITNCYASGDVGSLVNIVYYSGGFIGETEHAYISNCYSTGDVFGSSGGTGSLGGFVGFEYGLSYEGSRQISMYNCYSSGNVTGEYDNGGFLGYNDYGIISKCYATGNVYECSSGSGSAIFGGFVGEHETYPASTEAIINCYSTGDVILVEGSNSSVAGGFCGVARSSITNSYSEGNVIAYADHDYLGGFAGSTDDYYEGVTLLNCFSVGTVTGGGTKVGGFIGSRDVASYLITITNCAWNTASSDYAIGSPQTATLAENGEGTDESTLSNLWYNTHAVYDQGNPDAWDFATPIWYERYDCSDYPKFSACIITELPFIFYSRGASKPIIFYARNGTHPIKLYSREES